MQGLDILKSDNGHLNIHAEKCFIVVKLKWRKTSPCSWFKTMLSHKSTLHFQSFLQVYKDTTQYFLFYLFFFFLMCFNYLKLQSRIFPCRSLSLFFSLMLAFLLSCSLACFSFLAFPFLLFLSLPVQFIQSKSTSGHMKVTSYIPIMTSQGSNPRLSVQH